VDSNHKPHLNLTAIVVRIAHLGEELTRKQAKRYPAYGDMMRAAHPDPEVRDQAMGRVMTGTR
jgi:hypothetical protein